ncbi:alpha/beta fold hydrolase [Kribbella kalugense]|uniref:4,5:9,10-diseco-3-hydroxy-5,9, 17-trioxoandrosta-1(10),2-diene-4-oate hydrolase n=1 Tax=Kribbella kalugense TaxID=2512221 RepID=A0A4R7Z9Z1_9ACTN|nr:alpha/beta fold hydrolase [Kribbella kalugense]TDW14239.1 4,5:9,10-diseco-3-hydroxy-5,9,17-trioxoandrosta-1(10),2-diene-4-oate hydrolase [Kribbella kalugense]
MRRIVAGVHGVLAGLHVWWATGTTWPAADERSLSMAVLGGQASFAPRVVLPLALLHVLLAVAILTSERWKLSRLVVGVLAAGLAARAAAGLVWITGVGTTPAFYWLNLLVYTPICIALCVADLKMLRVRRLKAALVAGPVAVVTVLALIAYVYQPAERPHPAASVDSRYVDTPLARIHYLQRGTGSPVVLLSPGAAPASAWNAELADLARDHAVYAVDLPGQGETRLHDERFTFDLNGMTTALGQFLDALHLPRVALGGNSWSGGWGLAYAQRHPDRVSKLVLLAPSGLDEPDVWSWEILKQPLVGEALAKLAANRSMVESAVRGLFAHQELVTPQLVDSMWIPGTYRDNVRSMYALERGLDWSVTEKALPSTGQPTLVLWGDRDTVLPVAQAARFGKLLPNATVRVLPDCGHALTVDCADRVTPLLSAYLK